MKWDLTFKDVKIVPLKIVKIDRNMWGKFLKMFCSIVDYIVPFRIRFKKRNYKFEFSSCLKMS